MSIAGDSDMMTSVASHMVMDTIETLPLSSLLPDGKYNNIEEQNKLIQIALTNACDEGCLQKVVSLIRHGADKDHVDGSNMTPLMRACSRGFTPIVEFLVENGATIICDNDNIETGHMSALNTAIENSNSSIAKYLINKTASSSTLWQRGTVSPLMWASVKGWEDVVELLISKGASVNYKHYRIEKTALMHACENNRPGVAKALLNSNADVNVIDSKSTTALMYACENVMDDVVKLMLLNGIDDEIAFHALVTCKNTLSSSLFPVYSYFASKGNLHFENIWYVLQKPVADVVEQDILDKACFVQSCVFENDDGNGSSSSNGYEVWMCIVKYMAAVIAVQRKKEMMGRILKRCIDVGKLNGVKLLFDHDYEGSISSRPFVWKSGLKSLPTDPDNPKRLTPLAYALYHNQIHIATWLLGELDQNSVEVTFGLLCEDGFKDGVAFILQHGIDLAFINRTLPEESGNDDESSSSNTSSEYNRRNWYDSDESGSESESDEECEKPAPLIRASTGGFFQVMQLLLDYGADVNIQDVQTGHTSLMACLANKTSKYHYETVDTLLNNGADLDVVDNLGNSALTYAFRTCVCISFEKTLKRFVESGQLMTSENRLKPVHCKVPPGVSFSALKHDIFPILVELGIFEWGLILGKKCKSESIVPEAIASGLSPPGGAHSGPHLSPLVVSFLDRELELTLLILDKLYFLPEDYQELKSLCFRGEGMGKPQITLDSDEEGEQLDEFDEIRMHQLLHLDRPQRLKDICFLSISRPISVNYPPCARKQMVARLPLPNPLKKQLMFQ